MGIIGVNIRKARERLGMTQQQLANKLGYPSVLTIGAIENGAKPVMALELQKIAKALFVDFYALLGPEPLPKYPSVMWCKNIGGHYDTGR